MYDSQFWFHEIHGAVMIDLYLNHSVYFELNNDNVIEMLKQVDPNQDDVEAALVAIGFVLIDHLPLTK